MSSQDVSAVSAPAAKVTTVWAAFGLTTWSDIAAAAATAYTALLIVEWLWNKLIRPYAERRGWIARRKRRKDDAD